MERKSNIRSVDEYFFASPLKDVDGNIVPAPEEAVRHYERLKAEWMNTPTSSRNEIPSVALYPVSEDGKTGYVVATRIVHRPSRNTRV